MRLIVGGAVKGIGCRPSMAYLDVAVSAMDGYASPLDDTPPQDFAVVSFTLGFWGPKQSFQHFNQRYFCCIKPKALSWNIIIVKRFET